MGFGLASWSLALVQKRIWKWEKTKALVWSEKFGLNLIKSCNIPNEAPSELATLMMSDTSDGAESFLTRVPPPFPLDARV